MSPLAQSLLASARREAVASKSQPDVILAETLAAVLSDTGKVIDGVSPGFLRRPPRHEVRAPKVERPVIEKTPIEELPR
jgi:hypothetical protein